MIEDRLNELRRELYLCTELRAEAIDEDDRRRWLVDVFSDQNDPVLELVEKVAWSAGRAVALGIAGGTGIGKTTQIYRLIDELWRSEELLAIRVNYEDYSSLSSPPDITDFLLSIAGGLAEEATALGHLPPDWDDVYVETRIMDLLRRLRFEPEVGAGPVKVKASLREDESFRRRLREHLSGQVAKVVDEVRTFVDEIVASIQAQTPGCRGVVMVVDSTERLSSPASSAVGMQDAVRNIFIQNGENLRFDRLHSMYLLPPWLPITDGGSLRMDTVVFPAIRVANRDDADAANGLEALDKIVRVRMPDINDLIGPSDLRELCRMSGGVQRVFFLLLKEVASRARGSLELPVSADTVQTAIDSVKQDYLAITVESAPALRMIDDSKSVDGLHEGSLGQLERYFQALVVLQVANGEKWFTIHPLMRQRLMLLTSEGF